eukprot:13222666-Alexandrium_andersonii.AAC.1
MHADDHTIAGEPVDLPAETQVTADGSLSYAEAARDLDTGAFDLDWELQAALDEWMLVETASPGSPVGPYAWHEAETARPL